MLVLDNIEICRGKRNSMYLDFVLLQHEYIIYIIEVDRKMAAVGIDKSGNLKNVACEDIHLIL